MNIHIIFVNMYTILIHTTNLFPHLFNLLLYILHITPYYITFTWVETGQHGSLKEITPGGFITTPSTVITNPPNNSNQTTGGPGAGGPENQKKIVTLTTRALLPFYKVDDVKRFCDIFAEADQDFQGDLNMDEWIKFFTRIDNKVSIQEARLVFMKVDENGSGSISLSELIPVVFSKASKAQVRLIEDYAGSMLIKERISETPIFTVSEVEQLFDAYDEENINFVLVDMIRDRAKNHYHLPEAVQYSFLKPIEAYEDDEMFNRVEFFRFLKPYISVNKSLNNENNP